MKRRKILVELPPITEEGASRTVRVILPLWLLDALEDQVRREYGPRGHSRWVDEAVIQLLTYPEWAELHVAPSDPRPGKAKTFTLSPRGAAALDEAIRIVRTNNPWFEGVISEILRTAIAQRLLRSGMKLERPASNS